MKTPLTQLPEEWQTHIRELRSERAWLRQELETPGRVVRGLRKDIAKMRIQRNEARAERDALRAELAARNGN